jgi:hypothetical protein
LKRHGKRHEHRLAEKVNEIFEKLGPAEKNLMAAEGYDVSMTFQTGKRHDVNSYLQEG